ncbi:MAG: glycosyltransferase family 4 protein [Acidimicrobiales bacterium]
MLEAVRGGTSRHVADLVRAAAGCEHHVALPPTHQEAGASGAVVDTASVEAMAGHGAVVHRVDMRRSACHPANLVAAVALSALVRRVGPAVVHGHSSVGGALARGAGRAAGLPVVYTPNGLATGRVAVRIERLLSHLTTALIASSASEAELAVGLGLIGGDRVRVIPNGIDLSPTVPDHVPDLRARLGLAAGTPLVGTVARLVEQKAPEEFVRVCAEVARRRADVHGLLVGMGPLAGAVDRAVASHGLEARLHRIAHLDRADTVLGQLDVFVLASRFEGGPYTPLEAMRAGVPVVLSDVVGNRDAVVAGRSGILCPFGDPAAMAGAVVGLLSPDGPRVQMVAEAHRRLADHFDVAEMGRRVADLYAEVTST